MVEKDRVCPGIAMYHTSIVTSSTLPHSLPPLRRRAPWFRRGYSVRARAAYPRQRRLLPKSNPKGNATTQDHADEARRTVGMSQAKCIFGETNASLIWGVIFIKKTKNQHVLALPLTHKPFFSPALPSFASTAMTLVAFHPPTLPDCQHCFCRRVLRRSPHPSRAVF